MSKLSFSGGGAKYDVLNFNTDAFVDFPSNIVLSGLTDPISFYLYLDSNNYASLGLIIYNCDDGVFDTHNELMVFLYNNYLWIQTGGGVGEKEKVDITNYANKTIFVEFKRTDGGQGSTIDYIKIDGVSQTLVESELTIGLFNEPFKIGALLNLNSMTYAVQLYSATVWNITIPGRYHWNGYIGNINSGWVDTIGGNNGAVSGATITSRTVTGTLTSKLKLGSGVTKLKL